MKFAKLNDDVLTRCPKLGYSENVLHYNLPVFYNDHPEKAFSDGWKELVETPRPEGNYIATYRKEGNTIVQEWLELPEPEPVPDPMKQIEQNTANIEFMAVYLDIPISEITEVLDDAQ